MIYNEDLHFLGISRVWIMRMHCFYTIGPIHPLRTCTPRYYIPQYKYGIRMISTHIMTWVYKDSFIFDTHQVSISGRFFDTIIGFEMHHPNFQKVSYCVIILLRSYLVVYNVFLIIDVLVLCHNLLHSSIMWYVLEETRSIMQLKMH